MDKDDAGGFDWDEFEVAFAKLERDLKLTFLQSKYVPMDPDDKEGLLAGLLAWRVITKASTFEESSASLVADYLALVDELIETMVSGMSEDELKRAGVVGKRRAEEWFKEIKDTGVPVVNDDSSEE